MFASARAKLTLWYLFLIVLISGTLSLAFFVRFSQVLQFEYNRIEQRFRREVNELSEPVRARALSAHRINVEDLELIRQSMILQLVLINMGIIVIFSIGGFFLSGITLAPIEEAHERQRRFVGDAAHELRTPISALKSSLEVSLLDKKITGYPRTVLSDNLEDVTNLEHLAESLLRLAKVSDQPISLEKVPAMPVVRAALKFTKHRAAEKDISIETKVPSTELTLVADRGALLDLVIILLDNAIKYSPYQSTITLGLQKTGRYATLTIADQGVGISQHHLPRIFDRFYRIDQARTVQAQKGYGLGLAVAKKIVQQHRGSISVKSKQGVGTSFTVTLPLA